MAPELQLPKGTAFEFRSGTFVATAAKIERETRAMSDALASAGISYAPGVGSAEWFDTIRSNVRLLKPMTESEVRNRVTRELAARFAMVSGNPITFWQKVGADYGGQALEAAKFTATESAKDIRDKAAELAPKFALGTGVVVGLALVGVLGWIYLQARVRSAAG